MKKIKLDINNFLKTEKKRKNINISSIKLLQKLMSTKHKPLYVVGTGIVDIIKPNIAFVRFLETGFRTTAIDIYLKTNVIKKYKLTQNKIIDFEATFFDCKVTEFKINRIDFGLIHFDKTTIHPIENINFSSNLTSKIVSFISPIGYGQRALIVSPPKVGKTRLIMNLLKSACEIKDPSIEIYVILCSERPEEYTEFNRINEKSNIIFSTFDDTPEIQVQTCFLGIEYIKKRALLNKKCIVFVDSLTRIVRAYNALGATSSGSKTLSGGIDYASLLFSKKFFGAARNFENSGSLTIIATCLINTNSRMDEVIYEEFKGTGNCEIVLSRSLAEAGIYPAIDIKKSSTRNYDLFVDSNSVEFLNNLRKELIVKDNPIDILKDIFKKLDKTKNPA